MLLAASRLFAGILLMGCASMALATQPLTLDVYNPGEEAMFPVSSVLVSGEKDAVLIDAQFARPQAERLVERIRSSGKRLTTIYISHGDPDYYFGLHTLIEAFPHAKVVASPRTVAHIERTMVAKLAYWGPKMGDGAPRRLIVPEPLQGSTLTLEDHALEVVGLDGAQPDRTFVWIPSIQAVVGGVVLSNNIHVWMADTRSPESHAHWLTTLEGIRQLEPVTVVPGHYLPGQLAPINAAQFTAEYIEAFDAETAKAKDSTALVKAMTARYPDLADESGLVLSAKVAKGEMDW